MLGKYDIFSFNKGIYENNPCKNISLNDFHIFEIVISDLYLIIILYYYRR